MLSEGIRHHRNLKRTNLSVLVALLPFLLFFFVLCFYELHSVPLNMKWLLMYALQLSFHASKGIKQLVWPV